jgi:hypothetical protein
MEEISHQNAPKKVVRLGIVQTAMDQLALPII